MSQKKEEEKKDSLREEDISTAPDEASHKDTPSHKKESEKTSKTETVSLPKQEHEALLKKIQELEGHKDELLRKAADYDNAKKRLVKEKEDFYKFATEQLIQELLPVLDNLNRAIEQAEKANPTDPILKGIHLIEKNVFTVLKKNGLTRIEALNQPFSVELHEAIGQVETSEKEEGTVVEEIETGYFLHHKLLRPSLVKVAKAPLNATETKEKENG